MMYSVLLYNKPADGYVAQALAWPGCTIEAPTREEAIASIRNAITQLLTEGEVIEVDVALPQAVNNATYAETFGMFRNDPTFPEFLQEIQQYRDQHNRIVGE